MVKFFARMKEGTPQKRKTLIIKIPAGELVGYERDLDAQLPTMLVKKETLEH